ncbi:YxcD family protein [Metabacillus litoralis]|uniref:YxcD family protein n=1 Tax=Metabacillus TaxID=2675233 RepID=UPI000EF5827F|nr:YxcD family protein [Metabacillus litoralis]MCM3408688.1 YxcD family protein [Metabacillus litoralis]UHA59653.1 YxcD family protein [Metabacillus litoralis]
MGQIKLSEQNIVNALCLHIAHKRQIKPQDVEIELLYDDDYGFSAEAYIQDRKQILITANIIEAIRFWLENEMNIDPFAAAIELVLDENEGIITLIK